MPHNPKKKLLGFSLLEILIAILVLGIGLLGLAQLQGVTLLNSAESRMQTHAVNLAQDKIEELRHYANKSVYTAYATDNVGTDVVGANATFTRTWTISACPNSVDCKQISVKVAWTGVDGTAYDVELTSEIAELEPGKSGMVVASVSWLGDSPAESAAKAAAHAAAAATYEAQVAASSDATDTQKAEAAAAKATADQAAADAQAAADTGDAAEAAAQAEIAAQAAADILAILQSLPGTSYNFTGTMPATSTSVTVEDGTCTFSGTGYSCSVSTFENEVTVTASDGTDSATCLVDLTASPVTGCTLAFSLDCTSPWSGPDIADGAFVTAYQTTSSTTCPSEQRLCTSGSLSGTYTNESCTIVCTVPNYVGSKINSVAQPWNTTGPGAVDSSDFSGNKTIASQNLTAGTTVDCTTTLVVFD